MEEICNEERNKELNELWEKQSKPRLLKLKEIFGKRD